MSTTIHWPFAGNARLGRMLLESWQSKTMPAVMVWRGPAEIGKASAAHWLARYSVCQNKTKAPCDVCASCRQSLTGSNPDIVTVQGTTEEPLSIDLVRSALKRFRFTPEHGKHRWLIMTDAEYLTEGASNAMLKFIEEPPAELTVIMTTAQPERILPTILSRAAIYYWHTATDVELDPLRPDGISDVRWRQLVARAAGRPGRLQTTLADQTQAELEDHYRDQLLEALVSGQPIRFAKPPTPVDVTKMLTVWELVIRELLLAKTETGSRRLWPNHPLIQTCIQKFEVAELLRFVERYHRRYQLLQHHVQPRFILEDLQLA